MTMLSKSDLARIKKYSGKKQSIAQTVARSQSYEQSQENHTLLQLCWQDWSNMHSIREEHRRNQRYKNGQQWDDWMKDPDHPYRYIREREYISRQGRTPITNNLVQQIDRNIHGQMLSNPTQPVVISRTEDDVPLSDMLTNALQKGLDLNKYGIQRISHLESLLSAGYCVAKVRYGIWDTKNRSDVKIDFVNINKFFFNQDAENPTLSDVHRIGELHDLTWNELLRDFYTGSASDEEALRREYAIAAEQRIELGNTAEDNLLSLDFYGTNNTSRYRVYEVWVKKTRKVQHVHDKAKGEEIFDEVNGAKYYDAVNAERRAQMVAYGVDEDTIQSQLIDHETIVEEYWEGRWLTPTGVCLKKMETPYAHQSHPYVIGCMPRIDGISKPVYSHINDTQRTINRHATMIDYSIANSAKGMLLVPQSMLKTHTLENIAHTWSSSDGVLVYDDTTPTNGVPKQLASSAIPAGVFDFLQMEMNNLKEISGLSGALSGQVARSSTPASLYAQQAQNSMLNFVLVFECFKDFNQQVCEKVLATQMQYYTTKRHVDTSGQTYNKEAIYYEPKMVEKIVDWNIVITEATDTPVFRQLGDDLLKYLFEAGAINVEMLLENSSAPFAQKLLAQVRSAQQQAQQGNIQGAAQQFGNMDMSEIQANPMSLQALQALYNNMSQQQAA